MTISEKTLIDLERNTQDLLEDSLIGATTVRRGIAQDAIRWKFYGVNARDTSESEQIAKVQEVQAALEAARNLYAIEVQTVADHIAQQRILINILGSLAVQHGIKLDWRFIHKMNHEHDLGEVLCSQKNGGVGCDVASFQKGAHNDEDELRFYLDHVYQPMCLLGHETMAQRKLYAYLGQWTRNFKLATDSAPMSEQFQAEYQHIWLANQQEVCLWPWIEKLGYVIDAWCHFLDRPGSRQAERRLVHTVNRQWDGLVYQPFWDERTAEFVDKVIAKPLDLLGSLSHALILYRGRDWFADAVLFQGGRLGDS